MKKSLVISAAALAALALVGCNLNGSEPQSYPYSVLASSLEVTNGVQTLTEHTWDDETDTKVSETQKVGNQLVYRISNYTSGSVGGVYAETRYRESYSTDGTPPRSYKLVSLYGARYGTNMLETKYEEFLLSGPDADETNPASRILQEWNQNGAHTDVKQFEGETQVLHQRNFRYNDLGMGYSYEESKNGGEYVPMYLKVLQRRGSAQVIVEYELYREWDGSTGTLVEKKSDYAQPDPATATYKITKWDDEGANPVVTEVTDKYMSLTIDPAK